jgi:glycosyltransferase involved in cell wall biosynthesis
MIKVLYIASSLKRLGPSNQLFSLIAELDRSQFEPYLLILSQGINSRIEDFNSLAVDIISPRMTRFKGLFFAKHFLKKLINEIKPNIIHTQGIRPDYLLSKIKPQVPWVLTVRNYAYHDYVMKFGYIVGNIMAKIHINIMRKCPNSIAVSEAISKLLNRHGVKTKTIYNGVVLKTNESKSILSLPKAPKPIFISVGSLAPGKNMGFLIKAFNKFSEHRTGTLLILGNGALKNKLKRFVKTENIKILSGAEDVSPFLNVSDYYLSASFSEGLPNAVLEALRAGLPMFISDIPPHREIAEKFPDSCMTFDLNKGTESLLHLLFKSKELFKYHSLDKNKRVLKRYFSAGAMSKNYQNFYINTLQNDIV